MDSVGGAAIVSALAQVWAGAEIGAGTEIHPFALVGKEPKGPVERTPIFARRLIIGRNCQIGPHVTLYFDVELGDEVLIGDAASVREGARIGDRCLISRCCTLNFNVTVGAGTRIMDSTHVVGDTVIGANCFIGVGVVMISDKSPGRLPYDPVRVHGPAIEDDVVVGSGAIILPVRIGKGAAIAAGALVTKDVPAGATAVGAPARW
jgi:acetyltransferase-like isoleucine patch superfamily enzyme